MGRERKDRGVLSVALGVVCILIGLATAPAVVVVVLLWTRTAEWQEVVGFINWLSRATAFGAAFAGLAALAAAGWAYHGVQVTVRSADQRELGTRETIDAREREAHRHERFTTIVGQLASSEATIQMGGLFSISALADEWEREARRLIQKSPAATHWANRQQGWQDAIEHSSRLRSDIRQHRESNVSYSHEKIENMRKQLLEADLSAVKARALYVLTRSSAPQHAKDAVAQRDACIKLVTAYLRDNHMKEVCAVAENAKFAQCPRLSNSKTEIVPCINFPGNPQGDHAARTAAVSVLHEHTETKALYPWPPQYINLAGSYLEGANLADSYLGGADLRGAHLRGADLRGAHLGGANLAEAHLEGANLAEAHLEGANLAEAHLEGANLAEAHLEGADLREAHLERANLTEAYLEEARLVFARLEGAIMPRVRLAGADLDSAYLMSTTMYGAQLKGTRLARARLDGADLSQTHAENALFLDAHLVGCNLFNANLDHANMSGAHLERANLRGAFLEGAYLEDTHFEEADLECANLSGAFLHGTYLQSADLRRAHLEGADLREAYLQHVYLYDTHLNNADLSGAHLKGVNLSRAHLGAHEGADSIRLINTPPWKNGILRAHWDETTDWPDGFDFEALVVRQAFDLERRLLDDAQD